MKNLDATLDAAEVVGFQLYAAVSVAATEEKADFFFTSWAGEVALERFRRARFN